MRSRLVLLLLLALTGLGLLAFLAGRAVLRGTFSAPRLQADARAQGEDVPLESEANSEHGTQGRAPRAPAEGTPAASDAPQTPLADARIAGLVVRPDGKPAALARVKYTQWRSDRGPEDQPEDSTVTDGQGLFTISPAPLGHLQLVALHDEFAESAVQEFDLAAGEQKRDLRLALLEFARIKGLVLDAHNVARARIAVTCEDWETRKALFAESDAAGRFEFAKVSPGIQIVSLKLSAQELEEIRADAPYIANSLSRADQEQRVEVAPGQTVELLLGGIPAEGVRVFGRVGSGGAAMPRIWIWAENFSAEWFVKPRARTDERGEYELWVPAQGKYDFHISGAGGGLHLARAETITGQHEQRLDFDVPGGSIRGRVVDAAGRPVPEAKLDLVMQGQGFEPQSDSYIPYVPFCTDDSEGRFAFVHLPAGRYDLRAKPLSKPAAGSDLAQASVRDLELAAGTAITDLEVVLTPGCTIRGVVHGVPEGLGRSVRVEAFDESGHVGGVVRLDADGSFVLRGLADGRYGLRASGMNLASPVSDPLRVRAGHDEELELTVAVGITPFLAVKWTGENPPRGLWFALRDARKNTIWETEFDDPPEEEPLLVVAPGSYEFELRGPGGWQGQETALLEAGKAARVEVVLGHSK